MTSGVRENTELPGYPDVSDDTSTQEQDMTSELDTTADIYTTNPETADSSSSSKLSNTPESQISDTAYSTTDIYSSAGTSDNQIPYYRSDISKVSTIPTKVVSSNTIPLPTSHGGLREFSTRTDSPKIFPSSTKPTQSMETFHFPSKGGIFRPEPSANGTDTELTSVPRSVTDNTTDTGNWTMSLDPNGEYSYTCIMSSHTLS